MHQRHAPDITTLFAIPSFPLKFNIWIKCLIMAFHEYNNEAELRQSLKDHMSVVSNQQRIPEYVFNSLVDEAVQSIVFEIHYQVKTGSINVLEGVAEKNKRWV